MGLRSWLQGLLARGSDERDAPAPGETGVDRAPAARPEPKAGDSDSPWEPVPAYLPVDPRDHAEVCAIACAIAAGDRPDSSFTVTGLSVANPEYRRVACIASALAAGALESSAFEIRHIYRNKAAAASTPTAPAKTALEETHAA